MISFLGFSSKNLIIGAAFLIAGLAFISSVNVQPDQSRESNPASLVIYFDDQFKRQFEGVVTPGMTVFQALQSSSLSGDLEVKYVTDEAGELEILAIDGRIGEGFRNWHFYLNGRQITMADTDNTAIKEGDLIEVRLE